MGQSLSSLLLGLFFDEFEVDYFFAGVVFGFDADDVGAGGDVVIGEATWEILAVFSHHDAVVLSTPGRN